MGSSPRRHLTSPVTPAMYPRRSRSTRNVHAGRELFRTLAHDSAPPSVRAHRRGKAAADPARLLFMKKPANPSGGSAGMRQILHKQRREAGEKERERWGKEGRRQEARWGRGCSRRWTAAKAGRGCSRRRPAAGHGRRLKTGDQDLAGTENGRPGRYDRAARFYVEWALRGSNPRPAD